MFDQICVFNDQLPQLLEMKHTFDIHKKFNGVTPTHRARNTGLARVAMVTQKIFEKVYGTYSSPLLY